MKLIIFYLFDFIFKLKILSCCSINNLDSNVIFYGFYILIKYLISQKRHIIIINKSICIFYIIFSERL